MRFVRYRYGKELAAFGWVEDDRIGPIVGDLFGEYRRLEAEIALDRVHLLSPVVPSKIICVGRNYVEHAKEQNAEIPEVPLLFLKPPTTIIGPEDKIVLPPQSQQVEHEAELAVVIGKQGRWITLDHAADYVLGCTIANDVTARDLQHRDGQWTRGKGFDTFCPVGPWIDSEIDPSDVLISCRVNGELRQIGSSREMIFSIPQLITYISSIMTLMPGDLILTGTPAGVGPLNAGDRVEVTIEGLGTLSNEVVGETLPSL
jgi:2-keto-4-pentenoate hydratase/2-oxohepta-3-ene-1,7-dioic acid hydratase in catechol pathway